MYTGRFAPSPTGPLHLGSLLTAIGSYLDAKHFEGLWLIRVEDLDPPREVEGAAQCHINTLARFGLHSDKDIIFQSQQIDHYQHFLQQLFQRNLVYHCPCTRKDLLKFYGKHPYGKCPGKNRQQKSCPPHTQTSVRIKTPHLRLTHQDLVCPSFSVELRSMSGDFILQRKDQLIAYHLAVTVDDHLQTISHIVRGADLLDSTAQQNFLQSVFQFKQPQYLHLPVVVHDDGSKLSKQTFANSIEHAPVAPTLLAILQALGQRFPNDLIMADPQRIIQWAIEHWSRQKIPCTEDIQSSTLERSINAFAKSRSDRLSPSA